MKKFLSDPRPTPKSPFSGFSGTLGHILLTDARNKLRQSADALRHSSELWQLDAEVMSVVPREGAGGRRSLLRGGGTAAPYRLVSLWHRCRMLSWPLTFRHESEKCCPISFSQWKQVLNVRLLEKRSGTAQALEAPKREEAVPGGLMQETGLWLGLISRCQQAGGLLLAREQCSQRHGTKRRARRRLAVGGARVQGVPVRTQS